MASMEIKSLDRPDETRPFAAKGQAAVVNLGGAAVLRATFEPGWRWSEHVKPLAKTDSCQAAHAAYVLSGRMGMTAPKARLDLAMPLLRSRATTPGSWATSPA